MKHDVSDVLDEALLFDTHFHVWDHSLGWHSWLSGPLPDLYCVGADAFSRVVTIADYQEEAEGLGVLPAVHVEATPDAPHRLSEIRWLEGLNESSGWPSAAVAAVDLTSDDVEPYLEAISASPIVRGVRQITTWDPDPRWSWCDDAYFMRQPSFRRGLALITQYGLSFDAQVYPHQCAEVLDVSRANEGLRLIINHSGMPRSWDHAGVEEWRNAMLRLANQPNVAVKLGGFAMTNHTWQVERAIDMMRWSIDAFGPDRVMFGSNFPVEVQHRRMADGVAAFRKALSGLSAEEQTWAMRGSAISWYRLEGEMPS